MIYTHTLGVRTLTRCYFGHSIGALSLATQLRYADKRVVNIMEVHIYIYIYKGTTKKMLTLIMFNFAKRRIRLPNA